jgi:hypothetical protein
MHYMGTYSRAWATVRVGPVSPVELDFRQHHCHGVASVGQRGTDTHTTQHHTSTCLSGARRSANLRILVYDGDLWGVNCAIRKQCSGRIRVMMLRRAHGTHVPQRMKQRVCSESAA